MGKTLYFECFSGISGDMTAAALLDTGLCDEKRLVSQLKSLLPGEIDIKITRVVKSGIEACKFDVILNDHHEHDHHGHRRLCDIEAVIMNSTMTGGAKDIAMRIFNLLGDAEAKAHGIPKHEVHFHEVGAADSITDIAAAAIMTDEIGADEIYTSQIYEGTGFIKSSHGEIPVPVPATLGIMTLKNLPLTVIPSRRGEMVTPTGAAILGELAKPLDFPLNIGGSVACGIGAGTKDFDHANILRVYVLDAETANADEVCVLSANIDDGTGEELGFCRDALIAAGALDVSFCPAFMKKGRPAYVLTALCSPRDEKRIAELIFKTTPTIGMRTEIQKRIIMTRETLDIATSYGSIRVKKSSYGDAVKYKAEYDDAAEAAAKNSVSYRTAAAQAEYLASMGGK